MKDKLTLQDIVDLMAKKAGLTKKEADVFFREFLAVLTDNIFNDEPVKIKDFGTFKLTKVSSRESVDVNTGEKIEIPAHDKLSFIPDKALKSLVNKPFEQFETTLLENAVSFDSIEESEEPAETPEDEDTGIDETEAIPTTKSKEIDAVEPQRQKEDIISKIEKISSVLPNQLKTNEPEKTATKDKEKANTVSTSFVYTYVSESDKNDNNSSVTLTIPSQQLAIDPKNLAIHEQAVKQQPVEKAEEVVDEDIDGGVEVSLDINKVQEKIDQLKEAIDALTKITWQGDLPVDSLSSKPIVEEADVYKIESENSLPQFETPEQIQAPDKNEFIESPKLSDVNIDNQPEEVAEEEEIVYEDITSEITSDKRDDDLLKRLINIEDGIYNPEDETVVKKEDKAEVTKEEEEITEDETLVDTLSEDNLDFEIENDDISDINNDDDVNFYDYHKETAWVKIRRRLPMIIFLLFVIAFGVYLFSKLFNQKTEYENYKGYRNLTESDTLPNTKIPPLVSDLNEDSINNTTIADTAKKVTANALPTDSLAAKTEHKELDGEYDAIISKNLKIKVLAKAAYVKNGNTRPETEHNTSNTTTSANSSTSADGKKTTLPVSETIKTGSSLRSIAIKHYGNNVFWVYIYEENKNKIKNFDNLSIGQVLVIPDLKKYNISPINPQDINKAKQLESSIMTKGR